MNQARLLVFLKIDEVGLRVGGRPGGAVPWSEIEACAHTIERKRKVPRIFLRLGPTWEVATLAAA